MSAFKDFKVSVIIPVYNSARFIETAVRSVLSQPEVTELILADDGSSDNSLAICNHLRSEDARIKIVTHPGNKNHGTAATRNLGIQNATEKYIAFLDADDHYLPNRFVRTAELFNSSNTIDGVYEMTGVDTETGEIKFYSRISAVAPEILFENLEPLGEKVWFSSNGLTAKRDLFLRAGLFDESLKTSEDTLQWFRLAASGNLVPGVIDKPVSMATYRPDSLTADKGPVQKDFIRMLNKLFSYCAKLKCSNARKELVIKKFFFFSSQPEYTKHFSRTEKLGLLMKLVTVDPSYMLFRSAAFRRYIGDSIGYNRIRK